MHDTRIQMGMPITVQIADTRATRSDIDCVYDYFVKIDEQFSPYKETSEVSRVNAGLPEDEWSNKMRDVMEKAEETKRLTSGYFDVMHEGIFDPSGIVKGWAIQQASELLTSRGLHDHYIEAGGDFAIRGFNSQSDPWRIGIRNPFNRNEIIKTFALTDCGIATSGTAVRGQHIYNPHKTGDDITDIISLTVIGPNVYEADRFATAAFAMGEQGIHFLEKLDGFEAYVVTKDKNALMTSGLEGYIYHA